MSRRVVHKLYWDFEKEERWLNEMAACGSSLVAYHWGTYTFEDTAPGAWIYRIELLPAGAKAAERREYLEFLSEAGIETVATYMRWAYFRRPAAEGPFELFSDLESRIAHYKRVLALFGLVTVLLGGAGSFGWIQLMNAADSTLEAVLLMPLFALWVLLVGVFSVQTLRMLRRVRWLGDQARLFE